MHMRAYWERNRSATYLLWDSQIPNTNLEKNLSIYINSDIKFSRQYIDGEKKAIQNLGYIGRYRYRYKAKIPQLGSG